MAETAHGTHGSTLSQDNCCEDHESYIPNVPISLLVAVLFFSVLFKLVDTLSRKSKQSFYFESPPPRFNYPQSFVLHCTYLN
ncbi:hypothetical protein OLMES_2729 [Oleiphilus messinensis]|uniref:Uncharacterized protein n=1 Tax=Oleiphilus messinensis TaxID=141451 RepID=A0A1Y0I9E4_9GAMM|nr:hypothetical protein OLMES_2729 [Oleiphilus messinensis]